MKTTISRSGTTLLLLSSLLVMGCAARSTGSTEVGVRTKKLFGAGIENRIYAPGATYFFFPFLSDWATFDISLQNLEMTSDAKRGDRKGDDTVRFKTTDGNDIRVNVTVAWRIDPQKTPHLLARVGSSTADVKEHLVRPACRAYVRDVLNEMHSEQYYVSSKRFEKASLAAKKLRKELGPEGIIIEQVLLGEHHFNKQYEKVIHDRKIAEQNAERLKSEALAVDAEARRNLERARGDVQVSVAKAKGKSQQILIGAERRYYEKERESQALLAEKTARATGIERKNKALAGAGGRTLVKLRIAEALQGKPIIIVPAGSGANIQRLDINKLIQTVVAQDAIK